MTFVLCHVLLVCVRVCVYYGACKLCCDTDALTHVCYCVKIHRQAGDISWK